MEAAGGPVLAVIDLVNGTQTARFAFDALRKGGKLIQVGLFGGELTLPLPLMAIRALTVQGSYVGNPKELRELVKLAQDGALPALAGGDACRRREAYDALMRLRDGKVTGRLVLQRPRRSLRESARATAAVSRSPPCLQTPSAVGRQRRVPEARISSSARTPVPDARAGRGRHPHDLALDRSLHARPAARAADLCPAIQIGEVMTGETVGEVIASADPGFAPGDIVVGARGWQTHCLTPARSAGEAGPARRAAVGVSRRAGHAGRHRLSRHHRNLPAEGRRDRGGLGGVRRGRLGGGAVGQASRRARGRRRRRGGEMPVRAGNAGVRRLRRSSLDRPAARAGGVLPNGIDGYFENVGGAVQAAVFDLLNPFARVAMCGMVSQYNEAEFPPGPNLGFVVGKRVLIQGFIVSDKPEKLAEWRALAAPWVADGSLAYREDVHRGAGTGAGCAGRHSGRAEFRQAAGQGRGGSGTERGTWRKTNGRSGVARHADRLAPPSARASGTDAAREGDRGLRAARKLTELGVPFVAGVGGHGVVATISRGQSNRSVGLRADMDALPITETTGAAVCLDQSRRDACLRP